MSIGKQPDLTQIDPEQPDYRTRYADAFDYAHQAYDHKQLKEFVLAQTGRTDLYDLPAYRFATIGKIAWILLEGGKIAEKNQIWFNERLEELTRLTITEADALPAEHPRVRDTQDYISLYTRLDRLMVTSPTLLDIRTAIQSVETRNSVLRQTLTHYEENLQEAKNERLASWVSSLTLIVAELRAVVSNNVASRKIQQKQTGRAAKQVKAVQIKQQDSEYNLVSINPVDLVGAKLAVLFNTKTRKASLLFAEDSGFTVSGTTIKGLDETRSYSKLLRKTEENLAAINGANSDARIETIFKDRLASKAGKVTGRLNSDTVILKVF